MAPKKATRRSRTAHAPVLRLRLIALGVAAMAVIVAGPLLSVRKQVYLRDLAIRRESLADSLKSAERAAAGLTVELRTLASAPRLERIARSRLQMDYPTSDQIVIVERRTQPAATGGGFVKLLKRSLGQSRNK